MALNADPVQIERQKHKGIILAPTNPLKPMGLTSTTSTDFTRL